ncbi:Ku protein [Mangrovactinospora gilvigrisea]|uniref:Non-homologous end joining protein Ku n=1 Tax=Mangrovactinospora gilvigrisea TaxID=1428644 RepID=A0A1J7BLM9_9ACTN|nr:Ku protein [Mangrovactinospora gilvigrisea]OIV39509.1 Ku protein [Mangrovactinospora gilvigrisea]
MPATIFKGSIAFGLVSVPVQLIAAAESKQVTLHQVHKADGGRVRNKKICERDEKELANDEIAKAYTAPDGQVAVLTDEDFDHLPLPSAHEIALERFVAVDEIDPAMWSTAYLAEPEPKRPGKPYVLLRDALAEAGVVGIARVALRTRESLCAVRAMGELLVVQLLRWPDEVRDRSGMHVPDDTLHRNELRMAMDLIKGMSRDFSMDDLPPDHYREALEQLVEAKLDDAPLPETPSAEAQGGQVMDLMDALKKSVAETKDGSGPKKKTPAKKTAARKRKAS